MGQECLQTGFDGGPAGTRCGEKSCESHQPHLPLWAADAAPKSRLLPLLPTGDTHGVCFWINCSSAEDKDMPRDVLEP